MDEAPVVATEVGRGYRLLSYKSIGSTNSAGMERLRSGDPGQLWITAAEQTAGRGRRGRVWTAPQGNLSVSLGILVEKPPAMAATIGFVAGLALKLALDDLFLRAGLEPAHSAKTGKLALKWPNDITLGEAKLAGLLLEAEPIGAGRLGIVIGWGVNVVAAPEGLPYPAVAIRDAGIDITAAMVLAGLVEQWPQLYDMWNQPDGFDVIRSRWLSHARGLGERVTVTLGSQVMSGTFETIDADGRLILNDDRTGRHAIAAGDVHFGAAATARRED